MKFKFFDFDSQKFLLPENVLLRGDGIVFCRAEEKILNGEIRPFTGFYDINANEIYHKDRISCTFTLKNYPTLYMDNVMVDYDYGWGTVVWYDGDSYSLGRCRNIKLLKNV